MKAAPVPQKDGPRINRDIHAREVQLIDAEGKNLGVVEFVQAQQLADDAGLDLVEIVPTADPPVCKILDYGKFRFLEQKKSAEARKKQKIVEIKEIKLRPCIDDHNYGVKMKAVRRFFEEGDKVKVTLRFRGREMASGTGIPPARTGEIRDRGHRQGRSRAVHGRPPDDHGSRAKIGIGASWPSLAGSYGARSPVFS